MMTEERIKELYAECKDDRWSVYADYVLECLDEIERLNGIVAAFKEMMNYTSEKNKLLATLESMRQDNNEMKARLDAIYNMYA